VELKGLRVVFLGTAGSFPTIDRGLPAIAIHRGKELFLFDCGEGAQRQMFIAQIGFRYTLRVFITHMHGDHVLGLPGLLQTMSLFNVKHPVEVYGPPGICNFLCAIMETLRFHLTFPIKVIEVKEGIVCNESEYWVRSVWTDHRVPNLAYAILEKERPGKFYPEKARSLGVPEGPLWSRLQHGEEVTLDDGRVIVPEQVLGPPRRGRKIVYSGDTKPCDALLELARDADLLIHEATIDDELAERAGQFGHSTPCQAALLAKEANVKRLVLTHIGLRYSDAAVLGKQAEKIFPNVEVAKDFMELTIPYPD
jgi:ribonuclease Z